MNAKAIEAYCSWCFNKTVHKPLLLRPILRDTYQCNICGNLTLKCRAPRCLHMTKGQPNLDGINENGKSILRKLGNYWDNEFCAEHNGAIASFLRLGIKLEDIEDYGEIFKRDTWNYIKVGKMAGISTAAGVIIAATAGLAAPGIAAALGASGLLATAGTGTAIVTLSGAALTSASLAAIGGTMVGGVIVLSAAGACLGAGMGGAIGNAYYKSIKNFKISKYNEGVNPAVIFINGFLTQEKNDVFDWKRGLRTKFIEHPWYHVNWESKSLSNLGNLLGPNVSSKSALKFAKMMAKVGSKRAAKRIAPFSWSFTLGDLAKNPWHVAMYRSSQTGALLADLIARSENQEFILMGHSLGARVIYYTLLALATRKDIRKIKDVYLFGGAIDGRDNEGWGNCTNAVSGSIYNFYTNNDSVLKYLYKLGNVGIGDPIGCSGITCDNGQIINFDFTHKISSHDEWKTKLGEILNSMD